MAGAKKRREGDPDLYKPATGRKQRAHEQNPEFEMPYYRYQRASCQAVPRRLGSAAMNRCSD
jgi:hypothetical protein